MTRAEFLDLLERALTAAGATVTRYSSAPSVDDIAVDVQGQRYRLRVTRTAPPR